MQLAFAFVADAATIAPDGKVYALGGDFQEIRLRRFPGILPAVSLLARLTALLEERGRIYQFRVVLQDPEGESVYPEAVFPLQVPEETRTPDLPLRLGFVINLQQVPLPREGLYAFTINMDGREIGRVPVHVSQDPLAQEDEPETSVAESET